MAVTSDRMSSRSALQLFVVIGVLTLAASTGDALTIRNAGGSAIAVFVPPICKPCYCPQIYCIQAPCPQNCPCPCQLSGPCPRTDCFCTLQCREHGTVVAAGISVILALDITVEFPLQYLSVVTADGKVFNVQAVDLTLISRTAKLVIYGGPLCRNSAKAGLRALLYPDPKAAAYKDICLLPGTKYNGP